MFFRAESLGARWLRPHFLTAQFAGPVTFSGSGWCWWLADEGAQIPARMFDHYLQAGDSTGITLLREKAAKSRRLYRLAAPSGLPDTPSYFVKQMALIPRKRFGALLGCSNPLVGCSHGTAELARNLALNERTVHGIRTFAFGEYFRFGLPVQQVLLQEYLAGWQSFTTTWQQHEHDAVRRRALLWQVMDVLASLRDAGICHLDLHPGNIMVSPDPQAPLRVIDCGQMCLAVDPVVSTVLHLGVFLHELNGKRTLPSPALEEGARELLYRLAGTEAGLTRAERLLPLLVRYSTKKPFSRRRLLQCKRKALDPGALERHLKKMSQSRPLSSAAQVSGSGGQQEQQLIASIDDMLTTMG